MLVVGIKGPKFSGKDTFATMLLEENSKNDDPVPMHAFAFAYMLKKTCGMVFHLSHEQLHGSKEEKEAVDPRWDKSGRELMQLWGTEIGRAIDSQVWVKNLNLQIESWAKGIKGGSSTAVALVTDCRFLNEAAYVRSEGGLIIEIQRDDAFTGLLEGHASEIEMREIRADLLVDNNGTLEDLRESAQTVLEVLREDVEGR